MSSILYSSLVWLKTTSFCSLCMMDHGEKCGFYDQGSALMVRTMRYTTNPHDVILTIWLSLLLYSSLLKIIKVYNFFTTQLASYIISYFR